MNKESVFRSTLAKFLYFWSTDLHPNIYSYVKKMEGWTTFTYASRATELPIFSYSEKT